MKKLIFIAVLMTFLFAIQSAYANELTINLTSSQKVYTQAIGKGLLLRVTKESSVKHKNFGWIIEVVKKPYRKNSRNLIYQNKTGTTADLSQVYAWQVGHGDFPNKRNLLIKNYRLNIGINLIKPKTKGENENAGFVSGKLKITW